MISIYGFVKECPIRRNIQIKKKRFLPLNLPLCFHNANFLRMRRQACFSKLLNNSLESKQEPQKTYAGKEEINKPKILQSEVEKEGILA